MMAALSSVLGEVKGRRRPQWKFPCSVCCKPVKCNQKGLFCDLCNRWCHSRCSDVSDIQYARLSALGPESPWYCQACTIQQLPFADCSFVSDNVSSISDVSCDEEDHPLLCNSTVVFCHINIRSLVPVFDELTTFLVNFQRPVILGVTETWLGPAVSLSEVSVPGYSSYRRDRDSRCGGVLVYVSYSCRSWRRFDLESSDVEAVWVELRVVSHPVLLCVVYRSPSSDAGVFNCIANMLELANKENKEVILMGDLNVNLLGAGSLVSASSLIIEEFCLTQSTRVTPTSESLIDVLFTTRPDLFASSGTFPFSNSDHLLIYGERTGRIEAAQSYTRVRCYKKCDLDTFLADLNDVPWHTMEVFTSVDDKLDCWKSLFTSVVDDHFPLHTVRLRSHSLKWMNDRIIKLMRSRNYFRTKFKRTRCSSDWNKFKLLKKAVIRELRRAKADYFANVASTTHNPRKGWNLLNSAVRPKQKGHISSIVTSSGESVTSSTDIVHSFNNHFSALYNTLPSARHCVPDFGIGSNQFHFVPVSVEAVLDGLNSLVVSKATGPDGLSARILKLAAPMIAGSLCTLFNACQVFFLMTGSLLMFILCLSLVIVAFSPITGQFLYFRF